ncbi:biofilm regulation diguanylate cyclase SiaD [Halomonas sp. I1]|uniref:biofilm regulation diguanylate cyclase SiaD n=1 Tax=Halomonas sp. I1 TaxID=393536 RepID=UPI0028DFB7A8|nr:biofilm regulation diguanylate cyclase SiaD [Halomonas sp. I1]MDT8894151.1 biofilm regulation diguanylate cyclase SiaD [Halomonas sp. I1]
MKHQEPPLLEHVEALLAEPANRDHPLHDALERLFHHHLEQQDRLERLISIADGFQQSAHADLNSTRDQLERQLKRQRKLSRIADRYQSLLRERNLALKAASAVDPLTGLANRRRLHEQLEQLTATSSRHHRPFTLAMVDIDHFKRVNDYHGHGVGDRALEILASTLQDSLRASDHCGRWGGEEFLLLLPETPLPQATSLMERLGERLRGLKIPVEANIKITLTASIGVAEHRPEDDIQATIQRADQALLAAKREGRDRWRAAE